MPKKEVKTYKQLLQTRLTVESHRIQQLTAQAKADYEHDESLAEFDVHAIIRYICSQPANERKAGIYLIDSICQTIGKKYILLFSEHIVGLMEATYRYGNNDTKTMCKRILQIWKERKIFNNNLLRQIYNKLREHSNNNNNNNNNVNQYGGSSNMYPISNQQQYPYGNNGYHHQQQHGYPPQQIHYNYGPNNHDMNMHNINNNVINNNGNNNNNERDQMKSLIYELSKFLNDPYNYRDGLQIATRSIESNWNVSHELQQTFVNLRSSFDQRQRTVIEISKDIHFILNKLKRQGVNTTLWEDMLRPIAPFLKQKKRSISSKKRGRDEKEICPFFNSNDGCHKGTSCGMLHDTTFRAAKKSKLEERVAGRWNDSDVVYTDESQKTIDFYSFFKKGDEFKKKHARSLSMIYSKKLQKCPNCGLRLPDKALPNHLNWHFKTRNKIKKLQTSFINGLCRHWYLEKESWLIDDPFDNSTESTINPFTNINNENESNLVSTINDDNYYKKSKIFLEKKNGNENLPICHICHDKFTDSHKNYDTNLDEWMLENACYIDGTTYQDHGNIIPILKICHRKCYDIRTNEINNGTTRLIPEINNTNDFENNLKEIVNSESNDDELSNFNSISDIDDDNDDDIDINKNRNIGNGGKISDVEEDIDISENKQDIAKNKDNNNNDDNTNEKKENNESENKKDEIIGMPKLEKEGDISKESTEIIQNENNINNDEKNKEKLEEKKNENNDKNEEESESDYDDIDIDEDIEDGDLDAITFG